MRPEDKRARTPIVAFMIVRDAALRYRNAYRTRESLALEIDHETALVGIDAERLPHLRRASEEERAARAALFAVLDGWETGEWEVDW